MLIRNFNQMPKVGVTGPEFGGFGMWIFTALAVLRAGGLPIRITTAHPRPDKIDALILGGGSDINTRLYGEERSEFKKEVKSIGSVSHLIKFILAVLTAFVRWLFRSSKGLEIDIPRDNLELELLKVFEENDLPVLGICRGAQLMNVHAGGTLHQALSGLYVETKEIRTIFARKRINVLKESLLAKVTSRNNLLVNSLHRQGVNQLGPGLVTSGTDLNGIVQAIENPKNKFYLGVQWHPEFLPQVKEQQLIFKSLIKAVKTNNV